MINKIKENIFGKKLVTLIFLFFIILFLYSCSKEESVIQVDQASIDLANNKIIAQTMVHSTALELGQLLKTVTTDSAKINLIRILIDPVRFYPDSSGYFYAYDYNCVCIAHATQKNLVNTNLYNYTDTKGKYVIRELLAAAKAGGGFVEFYWIKPGETGEKKKLGYVETIPGTNYFIGSGVYIP
jgi:signal transduction histidine kinase